MRKKTMVRAVSCALLFGLATSSTYLYAAQDWRPELWKPIKEFRGPSDPIRISLKLSPAALQKLSLAIELDDIDVTGLVALEGNVAVYTPPEPLAYGEHQLRVVEHAADGSIIERGAWTIEVRQSSTFREAEVQAAVNLNLTRRIADHDLVNPPDRSQADGTAQIQAAAANADWRFGAQVDIFANTNELLMPRQKDHVDVGRYLVTANSGGFTANVGHHQVGMDSLVMQSFNRRGASVAYNSTETGTSAAAFGLSSADIIGAQQGLVTNSENRVDGVTVAARPVSSARDALVVAGTYVTGEGPNQTGVGIGGDPTVTGGHAGGIVADGNLLERRLRLRGEWATSDFDFDGVNTGNSPESGRAHAALLTYSPWHSKVVRNQPMALNFGIENKKIGTFYRSPANPAGISDRKATRGFAGFNWFGFDVNASFGVEEDNVDNEVLLPRTQSDQGVLSLSYSPLPDYSEQTSGQPPKTPWYGQPYYNLTWVSLDQEVDKAAAGLSKGGFHETENVAATASFNYPTWSWAITHSVGRDEDLTNLAPDNRSRMTQLNASFRIGERLSLGPTLGHNKIKQSGAVGARDSETTTMGLAASYLFTPKLTGNLGLTLNQEESKDNTVLLDKTTKDLTASLIYSVVQPEGNRPGLTLSLDGVVHDEKDDAPSAFIPDLDSYQLFFKVAIGWMPRSR